MHYVFPQTFPTKLSNQLLVDLFMLISIDLIFYFSILSSCTLDHLNFLLRHVYAHKKCHFILRCCFALQTEKCGSGIVADEDIKQGEFVIEYVGEGDLFNHYFLYVCHLYLACFIVLEAD